MVQIMSNDDKEMVNDFPVAGGADKPGLFFAALLAKENGVVAHSLPFFEQVFNTALGNVDLFIQKSWLNPGKPMRSARMKDNVRYANTRSVSMMCISNCLIVHLSGS